MNDVNNQYFISAAWRSSGKTLVTAGIARAALRRQQSVATFKKGPDYIDPLWMAAASGQPCYNLDSRIQSIAELKQTFSSASNNANLTLIEGTMGLHDGLAEDGSDCNASIARQLGVPVILVLDCRGMHRSAAALLNGLVQFDPAVNFAGVILNRVRTKRHGDKIQRAIAEHCDVKLLGMIPEDPAVHIDEKELGLVPAPDHPLAEQFINYAADLIEAHCDIDSLLGDPQKTHFKGVGRCIQPDTNNALRIGLARDEAFHFYYQDDLDYLKSKGVDLIEISPIRDQFPAQLDGLILGGGFPERHAQALSANYVFKEALAQAVRRGLAVHGECGGLMYLCRSLQHEDRDWPMVGVIDGDVKMCQSPKGRGYMQLAHTAAPHEADEQANERTNEGECDDTILNAHEFHHSHIVFDATPTYAYSVKRGYGVNGDNDGVCVNNVIASYAHFRHTESTPWIDWFLKRIERQHV